MFIPAYSKSNSPQRRSRVGLFLLVTSHWSLATVLIGILLNTGCADESINNPVAEKPVEDSKPDEIVSTSTNYFPMTVGSRWVYRDSDGSEWTREVTATEEVDTRHYHFFSYNPPIEDYQFAIFRAPVYIATLDSLFFKVENRDINDAIRNAILESNENSPRWHWFQIFQNGVWKTRKQGISLPCIVTMLAGLCLVKRDCCFVYRLFPVRRGTCSVLDSAVSCSCLTCGTLLNPMWRSSEELDTRIRLRLLAGIFEDCLNIQYEAKPPSVKTIGFADWSEVPEENVKIKRRKHMETEPSQGIDNSIDAYDAKIRVGIGVVGAWGWTGKNKECRGHDNID